MLDDHPQMTAVVSPHTDSSVGVVRAVQHRGLSIPRDFSLISVVADRIAQLISPPLTAISLPAYLMGERAAQMLIRMLQESDYEPEQELLKPHLVIRDSTGPAR
jgi:DNA-binding LacI/PurR family transcriptional regulator